MDSVDREELARFLRTRRERLDPVAAGLRDGSRRRTPGLRREEVAERAFISTEYYTRLEQARAPRPSSEVVTGLARALDLDDAERRHVHHLTRTAPSLPVAPPRELPAGIATLVQRLTHQAVIVTSASNEVIAWNGLAAALMEDFAAVPRHERNLVRRVFLGPHPEGRRLYGVSDADSFARTAAHALRACVARYSNDPEVRELVADLLAGSAEFRELWESHDVVVEPTMCKTFDHPLVGPVSVACDVLTVPDRDQHVIIYTAEPGSASAEALARLASLCSTSSSSSTSHPPPLRRASTSTR